MAVVGTAEVPVKPTFSGFQRDVDKQVAGVGAGFEGKQGRSLGGRLMSGIGTGLKYGALAVGTATAGILSTALVKGWQRLTAIENAEASLKGLGHSAQDVEGIMDNALNSVLGTAFGMGEAATVAASAVAAGIQPGEDLEGVLRLTADAATIAGTGMDEMGAIFNKVATSNKVQGDVIAQLNERGIPIIQMLSEELGVSAEETVALASAGEINFATFRSAMEEGVGGAAQAAGETTQGAFANMGAALSRFGATLLTGVFPLAQTVFGGITDLLDSMTEKAEPVVTAFSQNLVDGLTTFRDAWMGTSSNVQLSGFGAFIQKLGAGARSVFDSIVSWIGRFREAWRDSAGEVQASGVPGFFERFSEAASGAGGAASTASNILSGLGTVFAGLAETLPGLIRGGLDIVGDLIGWVADNMHIILPLIPAIAAGFVAWKVATAGLQFSMQRLMLVQASMAPVMLSSNIARIAAVRMERNLAIATGQATVATNAKTAAVRGQTAATAGATGAQRGLNAAMRANPIGAIITALTLLVGGLVVFFTQTEVGQRIWDRVWSAITGALTWAWESVIQPVFNWIGDAFMGLVSWFQSTAVPLLSGVWNAIAAGMTWLWETVISPVLGWIQSAWSAVMAAIQVVWQTVLQPTINAVGAIFRWLWNNVAMPVFDLIGAAWNVLVSVIQWAWEGVLRPVINLVGAIFRWLWNSVAMPIFGFIGSAWSGMITGIQAYWNNILRPVINLVGAIFRWLWQNIAQPMFASIGDSWSRMITGIQWVWQNVLSPVINAVGDIFSWLWHNAAKPIFSWISDAWDGMVSVIGDIWRNTLRPIFQAVGDFVVEDVVGMIQRGVDMIGDAWNAVANFFREPINWVINTVWNDGIKAAFDSVADAVGIDDRLGRIPTIQRFGGPSASSRSARGGSNTSVGFYAKGGRVTEDWYVAGEEGPELIHRGPQSHRVYTAEDTARMRGLPLDAPIGGIGSWASSAWNWGVDKASGAINWARGKLADGAAMVLDPIFEGLGRFASRFGHMGDLGAGVATWGKDKLLEWIRGEDDKAMAEGTFDGSFEGMPGNFHTPASGPITSGYGPRSIAQGFSNFHHGIDFGAPMGAAVRAAYDGVVRRTGWGPGNLGNIIVLNHGGYDTAYAHLSGIGVNAGQDVSGGQRIGSVGASGGPFAPHLHYERHRPAFYNPVNPLGRDDGGLLYPGLNHVVNWTGRPEYSFNERDFAEVRNIIRGGNAGGGGWQVTQNNYMSTSQYRDAADLKAQMRRERRKHRSGAR